MIAFRMTEVWPVWFTRKREFIRVLRESLSEGLKLWHEKFRAKHFTRDGMRQYGYTPRTPGYEARKQRTFGHRRPLVWSGASRTLAGIHNIRNLGTVSVRRPILATGLNRSPKKGRINMVKEMTTITPYEDREMVKVIDAKLTELLGNRSAMTTTQTYAFN